MAKTGKTTDTKSVPDTLKHLEVDPAKGLSASEAEKRLQHYGANALAEQKSSLFEKLKPFFWAPIPWMIEAAGVMALVVGDIGDFVIILVLLLMNAGLGFWEDHQASDALDALKSSLALKARALRDGKWAEVDATSLVPGDIVRIRLGDVVPADTLLIDGDYASIDQAALTGESLPVTRKARRGGLFRFDREAGRDGCGGHGNRKQHLLRQDGQAGAERRGDVAFPEGGHPHRRLSSSSSRSRWRSSWPRTGSAPCMANIDRDSLLRLATFVLILLVASVPVAMPAVLSVTMALGAKMLARKKAIVSRLESIEELAGIDILCSDKTGTLTQNKLTLGDVQPFGKAKPDDVVLAGALASRAEDHDPIDDAVLAGLKTTSALDAYKQTAYVPFDPVGKRTEATVQGRQGQDLQGEQGRASGHHRADQAQRCRTDQGGSACR